MSMSVSGLSSSVPFSTTLRTGGFSWHDPLTRTLVQATRGAAASVEIEALPCVAELLWRPAACTEDDWSRLGSQRALNENRHEQTQYTHLTCHNALLETEASIALVTRVARAASASCGFASELVDVPPVEKSYARLVRRRSFLRLDVKYITIPVFAKKNRAVKDVRWPVFLPHEFFGALVDLGLTCLLEPQQGDADKFWQNARREPWAANHPIYQLPENRWRDVIPLRLHGDEGQGTKKKSSDADCLAISIGPRTILAFPLSNMRGSG